MSQDQPSPSSRSSRRRRRGRGGGAGGGGGQSGAGVNPPAAPAQAGAAASGGRGRSGRGRGRSGGGGERGGGRRPGAARLSQPVRDLEITDERIFQRLLDSGLDLAQEAMVEAYLYFASEGAARRVAGQLENLGYTTYSDPSPPGRWVVEAVTRVVPSPENVAAMGSRLRTTAQSNGGSYDGWWAVEPPEEDLEVPLESTTAEALPALEFEAQPDPEPPNTSSSRAP